MIKNKRNMWFICTFLLMIVSVIQLFVFDNQYFLLKILNILYTFFFFIAFFPAAFEIDLYLTKIILLCTFLKFYVVPLLYQLCPVLNFSQYYLSNISDFNKGVILQIIELISIAIFSIYIYFKYRKIKISCTEISKIKNKIYYKLFILFGTILISLFLSRAFQTISFLFMKETSSGRIGMLELSTWDNFLRQFLMILINVIYVYLVCKYTEKWRINKKNLYIYIITAISIINLCIIYGEQRSSLVYTAFSVFCILVRLLPEYKKQIIRLIILVGGVAIGFVTIYKTFYTFNYSSYSDAIAKSGYNFSTFVKDLDIYLLGPLTYSSVFSFASSIGVYPISGLFYDLSRSFIGINFFIKDALTLGSSQLYNLYVTGGISTSGYLLPITGLGYLSLGWLFAPAILILILYFALKIEIKFRSSSNAIASYFLSFAYIRMATCLVFSNINTVITHVSTILLFAGSLILVEKILFSHRKNKKYTWRINDKKIT